MNQSVKLLIQIFVVILALNCVTTSADIKDINHAQLAEMQAVNPKMILLDVRTPAEFAQGHIEGAINIPHNNIKAIMQRVNKDDTVVLYCRSGRRVGLVTNYLNSQGYTGLHNLEGHMLKWWAEKKPVVQPK